MSSEETKVESKYDDYMKNTYTGNKYENKYAEILGAIAIIELIASIIGSIYIWKTMGTVEVGYYETETNPFGVGLSLVILIQGVVLFVVMQTLRVTAEDVAEMKNKSLRKEQAEN